MRIKCQTVYVVHRDLRVVVLDSNSIFSKSSWNWFLLYCFLFFFKYICFFKLCMKKPKSAKMIRWDLYIPYNHLFPIYVTDQLIYGAFSSLNGTYSSRNPCLSYFSPHWFMTGSKQLRALLFNFFYIMISH